MQTERHERPALEGSAKQVLAAGVSFLQPDEAVFEAMLIGWETQQRSRLLAAHTIWQRSLVVRRLVSFTNDYPWQWTPADVEEWTAEMVGRGLAHATLRNYQQIVAQFCDYLVDARYGWAEVCDQHFGGHPVQVFHEWNTASHRAEHEGRPGNRPLSREELQAFFDFCDEQAAKLASSGRKGWLAAFRDAVLFKVIYAWGLRRREAAMLDLADFSANATAPEFDRFGALAVRYGKALKGSPPRRRTVLTTMGWAAEAVAEWVSDIRPAYQSAGGWLWPTERGGRVKVEHINERFRTYRDELGLDPELGPHCLRHSYCSPSRGRFRPPVCPAAARPFLGFDHGAVYDDWDRLHQPRAASRAGPRVQRPAALRGQGDGTSPQVGVPLEPAAADGRTRHVRNHRPDPAARRTRCRVVRRPGLSAGDRHTGTAQPAHPGCALRHPRLHPGRVDRAGRRVPAGQGDRHHRHADDGGRARPHATPRGHHTPQQMSGQACAGCDRVVPLRGASEHGPICSACCARRNSGVCEVCGEHRRFNGRHAQGRRWCERCSKRERRRQADNGHRQRAVPFFRCGVRRPPNRRDAAGRPLCFACVHRERNGGEMEDSTRQIVQAVRATAPDIDEQVVRAAIHRVALKRGQRRAELADNGLHATPMSFPVARLVLALRAVGATELPVPECFGCGRPVHRPASTRGARICCPDCVDACTGCGQRRDGGRLLCSRCRRARAPGRHRGQCRDCAKPDKLLFEDGRCWHCHHRALRRCPQCDVPAPNLTSVGGERTCHSCALRHHLDQLLPADPQRPVDLLEADLPQLLADIDGPDRRTVTSWVRWQVLAPLRRPATRRRDLDLAVGNARRRLRQAAEFTAGLHRDGRQLAQTQQTDIDAWFAAPGAARHHARSFLAWAQRHGHLPKTLRLPPSRRGHSESPTDAEHRWQIARRLVTDDTLDPADRIAGALVVRYAQPLTRIAALTTDDVHRTEDGVVTVRLGRQDLEIPEPFATLIQQLPVSRRRGVVEQLPTRWLFPSTRAGKHTSTATLGNRLRAIGIEPRAARLAALTQLGAELPPAVLANILGIGVGTAARWAAQSGGNWTRYVAPAESSPV